MSYEAADQSVQDGKPIEVFKFFGSGRIFRYANNDEAVTVNGELYEPLNISRTPIEIGSVVDTTQTIDIQVPSSSDIAQFFALRDSRDELSIEVRSVHRGTDFATDWKMVWKAYVLYFSSSGLITTIQTGTLIQAALSANLNSVYCSLVCNHTLFDGRCGLIKADHTTTSFVQAISADGYEITVIDDGVANNDLRAGEIINKRTGERRFVIANALNSIDISIPFTDIIVGDEVDMIKGCIHSFSECDTKFSNIDRFGGFVYVPTENPIGGL